MIRSIFPIALCVVGSAMVKCSRSRKEGDLKGQWIRYSTLGSRSIMNKHDA